MSPSGEQNMNDAFSPLSHGGLESLVNDELSPPGAWLSSPLRECPSPALPSLPSSPATFPSANGGTVPLPHLTEEVVRSQFDLSHQGRAIASPSHQQGVGPPCHQHLRNPSLDHRGTSLPQSPVGHVSPNPGGAPAAGLKADSSAAALPEPAEGSEPTKACGLCQEQLPIAEFRINQRNTFGTYCLDCNALRSRHKHLRVAQLREMLAAGQISKSDVQAAVVAAHPDYALPGDASLPGTRECYICDFPKPITKFPAFGEMFSAADPPPTLGQPKRGLCCQKCDVAMRKAFHVPIQDLRSAAGAGTLADFMALAVPRNPNLSRLADVTPCGVCDAPRPVTELKEVSLDVADIGAAAQNGGGVDGHGGAAFDGARDGLGGAAAPCRPGFVKACIGCRRALRVWQGSLPDLKTAIAHGALAISHANPNNIPKAYRYARVCF